MRNTIKILSVITAISVVLSSCSSSENFAKRRYMPGVYMSKHHKKPTLDAIKTEFAVVKKSETKIVEQKEANAENVMASKSSSVEFAQKSTIENVKTKSHNRIKQVAKSENRLAENTALKTNFLSRYISAEQEITAKKSPIQELDGETVLLLILSFFIPPLAVYLKENTTSQWFWVTLLLCLVGAFGFWYLPFAGVAWLVAIVIAILVVFERL